MRIGVIGLGKLGLPLACVLKSAGNEVIGVDLNKEFVQIINSKHSPVEETGLSDMLVNYPIDAYDNYSCLDDVEVIFIIVPTPSRGDGRFSNEFIYKALDNIKNKDALIVITSTVMPGTCDFIKKRYGFNVCYNPLFIALGRVINDIKNPDFILLGESDNDSGDRLQKIWMQVCPTRTIKRMNLINAEISKLSLNVFVTQKINFANMLGSVCERVEGGNVDDVTDAIGCDTRVGKAFLKSGMAFGGPCFPRDNKAFNTFADELEVDADICLKVDFMNNVQYDRILNLIGEDKIQDKNIAILGMSYKPNTKFLGDSPSEWLSNALVDSGANILSWQEGISKMSKEDVIKKSDILIICHPTIKIYLDEARLMKKPFIIDCWRTNKHLNGIKGIKYKALGLNE